MGDTMNLDDKLSAWSPAVLSALRIMASLLFLQHGLVKLFGFPMAGPANFQIMSLIGLAALIEVVGGVLLTLGLFTRVVAIIMSGEMAFAYFIGHAPSSFYPIVNRGEAAILFCFVFLTIATAGGGRWSLDAARR